MNRRGFFGTLAAIAVGTVLPKSQAITGNTARLVSATPDFQTMDRGVFLGDSSFVYSNAGVMTLRGSDGKTSRV